MRFILFYSILLFSTGEAFASSLKNTWKTAMHAHWIDDELLRFRVISLVANSELLYRLSSNTSFSSRIDFSLELGNANGAFSSILEPERGIYLRQALLEHRWGNLHLGFGAINQDLFSSSLLFHHSVFPGIYEKLFLSSATWNIYLLAQQSITSSTSFSPSAFSKESTPMFYAYMAQIKRKDPFFYFLGNLAYFSFSNPNRDMAHSSRFLGTTVTGMGLIGAKFLYDYKGWIAVGKMSFGRRFLFSLDTNLVKNMKASKGKNMAWLLGMGIAYKTKNMHIFSKASLFRLESDYFPGIYTSEELGYSNREGKSLSLRFYLPKDKFSIKASYIISDTLEESLIQSDRNYLKISFMKDKF